MLFDPKIKHNGKIRNIQFFDPSKVTLKDFDTIKNNFKPGDSLLVNENDSITEAIAKIEESLHPAIKDDTVPRIDLDAMRKLYPNNVVSSNGDGSQLYEVSVRPSDGMKIIFTQPLDVVKKHEKLKKYSSPSAGMVAIAYNSLLEDENQWNLKFIDSRLLANSVTKVVIINDFMPSTFGDFEQSEFMHNYLIIEPYVPGTNYITIYKTNLTELEIYTNIGRTMY